MTDVEAEQQLIQAALGGDRASLEKLLLGYYDRLLAHIRSHIPPKLQGLLQDEDILQQTYAKAFAAIERFQPKSEYSFYSWLRTIANHYLLDCLRRRDVERLAHNSPALGDSINNSMRYMIDDITDSYLRPSKVAMNHELEAAFKVALANLSDDYREVIRLRYLESKSIEEVADQMQRSPDAIRGLIHRARQKMREEVVRLSNYI